MDIIEPSSQFDFSSLQLVQPVSIHGGAYFTKIENNRKTLYVQCPKSLTRQGFVKTGKKYHCDLMFDQTATGLIQWLEGLETRCREVLFQRRTEWFENSLEESDIENAFNSCIRVFKSGKYYLVRCNVRNTSSGQPSLRVYDERECILQLEDVTAEKQIISILEIQGIKFTTRSFQLEIILKQVMVIDDEPVFDNCLIRTSKISLAVEEKEKEGKIAFSRNDGPTKEEEEDSLQENLLAKASAKEMLTLEFEEEEKPEEGGSASHDESLPEQQQQPYAEQQQPPEFETSSSSLSSTSLPQSEKEEIEEEMVMVDMEPVEEIPSVDEGAGIYTLKKPNEVYMQLYREAKNKAKEAKRKAIEALLEAKNIKQTYMLEGDGDSDSDFEEDDGEEEKEEEEGRVEEEWRKEVEMLE